VKAPRTSIEQIRADCAARTEAYHEFYGFTMMMNEADARALAKGEVTERVREMARSMIDWEYDELERVAKLHAKDRRRSKQA